jgi:hypothetical protein
VTIEEGICERLESLAPVAALVGDRIYQLRLPQRSGLPAIRVQEISETEDLHLRGPSDLSTRVQVDVYAQESSGSDPWASAAAVAEAVHGNGLGPQASGLSGWIGSLGGSPPEIRVSLIRRVSRNQGYEAEELRLVWIRQDYRVFWRPMTD